MRNNDMPRTIKISVILLLALFVLGCGQDTGNEAVAEASPAESASQTVTRTYDKSVRERACEAMPVELVARLFDTPAEELEVGGGKYGCRYLLESEDHTIYAELYSITVFDDLEKAKRRYGDHTRNATQEDVDALKQELDRKLDKEKALKTETEKKTAKKLTGLMADLTPDGGLRHEPVEGLADEAKIDNQDGILRLRSGNMMFYIRAYNGPRQPRTGTSNMDEIMAEGRAWQAKTLPDRARATIKLAREVVPLMEKLAD
jgi:hypothetical protein